MKINGEVKLVPQNISILNLLKLYKINPERVVIELNKVVLKKEYYENTKLKENDELEIITFVGGG
ncbi:MAG: sulfur carrier protein ThiS [Candidatus Melainabacteria bacterium]|nr:sulfur carrier protein ThiS [Candidatus Melainabacteria bacterium]